MTKSALYYLLGQASALALMTTGAMAQEAQKGAEAIDENMVLEEVVVSGYRYSLQKARDLKKNSTEIVDGIIAEDIGKMPDENIAEALQRITGIAITRSQGEGSQVSIRGMGPALNRISVNGQTVSSGNDDQSVSFDVMSAGLLSSVEVVKTPSADMTEGSIGGSINLKTTRPLDVKGRRIVVSGQAVYSDLSGKWDPKLSASYVNQFADETVGLSLSLTYEDRALRQDTMQMFGYELPADVTGNRNANPKEADGTLAEGHADRFLPDGTDLGPFGAAVLRNINPRLFLEDRKRFGATATLQFRPNDTTEIILDGTYSKLNIDRERYQYVARFRNSGTIVPDSIIVNENNTVTSAMFNHNNNGRRPISISNNRWQEINTDTMILGGELKKDMGDLHVSAKLNYSRASQHKPRDIRMIFNNGANRFGLGYDFDSLGTVEVPAITVEDGHDIQDASIYRFSQLRQDRRDVIDSDFAAQLDFDWDKEFGMVNLIEAGFRYSSHTKDRSSFSGLIDGELLDTGFTIADVQQDFLVDDFLPGLGNEHTLRMWPLATLQGSFDALGIAEGDVNLPVDLLQTYEIKEKIFAGYLKANFASENNRFSGNLGVRLVQTKTTSAGFLDQGNGPEPTAPKKTYTNFLPSFNLRYAATDDIILRVAGGRVMARPGYDKVAPRFEVEPNQLTVRGGNPELEPYLADQIDIAVEYYMGETGLISAGFFYKNVKGFIISSRVEDTVLDPSGNCFLDPNEEAEVCGVFSINKPINGKSANVTGFEVNVQQQLDFLPGFLSNLGVQANYTYSNSEASVIDPNTGEALENTFTLPGLSKNTYNATIYYEDEKLSVRLSYNYRGKYLSNPFGVAGNTEWITAYEQLDLSAGYAVHDNVQLTFQVVNLTNSTNRSYFDQPATWEQLGTTERTGFYDLDGRKIRFGIRARF